MRTDSHINSSHIIGDSNIQIINNLTINLPVDGILAEFISYMNTLELEQQIKIMQFALKQKPAEKQVVS